ncbi:MAG: hypothetical protein ABJO27_21635 [Pseudoruegeria sp.]
MSLKKVALRYDAWPEIGLGHLRRGYSLALELTSRNIDYYHVVPERTVPILLRDGIAESQIIVCEPLNVDWLRNRPDISHVITDFHWHGNAPSASAEASLIASTGVCVSVIDCIAPDDYVDQSPAPNAVITPYLNAENLRNSPPKNTIWKNGARYSILSPEYKTWRAQSETSASGRILITCGGSDPDAFSIDTVTALLPLETPLDVVVGPLFSNQIKAELADLQKAFPQITLHDAPKSLAPLIARSACVVGRLGLIRYEAACLGKNGIFLSAGTAYREYLNGFKAQGFAEIFLDGDPNGRSNYLNRLRDLSNPKLRNIVFEPNTTAKELVDGNGAANVIDLIMSLPAGKLQ